MDDRDREALIVNNVRLVYKLARTIRHPAWWTFEDVVQIGMIGLIRAARTFDPSKGVRFSTYAYQCISHAMWNRRRDRSVRAARSGALEMLEVVEAPPAAEDEDAAVQVERLLHYIVGHRGREAVRLWFGLDGHEPMTLQEIGERMGGLSRERVRQLVRRAMGDMRRGIGLRLMARTKG